MQFLEYPVSKNICENGAGTNGREQDDQVLQQKLPK
jgi:hypothetical protein